MPMRLLCLAELGVATITCRLMRILVGLLAVFRGYARRAFGAAMPMAVLAMVHNAILLEHR